MENKLLLNEVTRIVKEVNKDYCKVVKSKIKEDKETLAYNVNETVLKELSFIKTNTSNIISWVENKSTQELVKREFSSYLEVALEKAFKIVDEKELEKEQNEKAKEVISQLLRRYFSYCTKELNKEVSKMDKGIIQELNNGIALLNDRSYKESTVSILGNDLDKKQVKTLSIAISSFKDKNIETLYKHIKALCIRQNNYPAKKISIDFEKSFKSIQLFEESMLIGISYSDALKLLLDIDEQRYFKLTQKKEVLYGDIISNIEKSSKKFVLKDIEQIVLTKYDIVLF